MTRKQIPPSIERPGGDPPPKAAPWHQVMIIGGQVVEMMGGRVYEGPDPVSECWKRTRKQYSEY